MAFGGFVLFIILVLIWAYISFSFMNSAEWGSVAGAIFYFTAVMWLGAAVGGLKDILGFPLVTIFWIRITPALLWGIFVSMYFSMSWQPKLSRAVVPVLFLCIVLTYLMTKWYFTMVH